MLSPWLQAPGSVFQILVCDPHGYIVNTDPETLLPLQSVSFRIGSVQIVHRSTQTVQRFVHV